MLPADFLIGDLVTQVSELEVLVKNLQFQVSMLEEKLATHHHWTFMPQSATSSPTEVL
jgi:hypothetical protein